MISRTMLCTLGPMLLLLPLPAHAANCVPPNWAPTALPGYKIESCGEKAWAVLNVDLADGAKAVAGQRSSVTYQLADEKKDAKAAVARDHYINQARKGGATLMSRADGYGAVLTRKTRDGEFWYVYEHGSGNEDSTGSYTLTTLRVAPLVQEVAAKPMTNLDVVNPACQDPPWLVRQFAYFQRKQCEKKIWDAVQVDLPDGARSLEGRRLTVTYDLTDDSKDPVAVAVGQNYVNALKAIGAKLASDPERIGAQAVLTQATPAGTVWYVVNHGTGNDDSTGSYNLTTILEAPPPQEVEARAMPTDGLQQPGKTCADPPWLVKQFGYFRVSRCDFHDFDQLTLSLPDGERTLAGRILTTDYALTEDVRDPVEAYVARNYASALRGVSADIVTPPEEVARVIAKQQTDHGEFWYVYEHTGGNDTSTPSYKLTTIQIGGPPPKACTLQVYGVNFDFDKAMLRPESTPVLNQLLGLFAADAGYAAEIGGHTDNVGGAAYNLKLSDARAAAVKAWLVGHGVAASRVTAHGYGDTKPLVPNTSDDNKAKNRRVELKRSQCKG
jgi:outer membrane protein OmpA-like peptidoglycan-associated protein